MDVNTMNQNQRILNHLVRYGTITPRQALDMYGVMRLGARIYELKRLGYNITKTMEKGKNRYGEQTNFARYYYKGNS